MEFVSYVGYVSLIILSIAWTINVRVSADADIPAILRAVYFVVSIAVIPVFGMNLAHALWIIPFGCLFAKIIAPALISIPVISVPFIVTANGFARFVRTGMPTSELEESTEG